MVRKVVQPARISVRAVVPRAFSAKNFSSITKVQGGDERCVRETGERPRTRGASHRTTSRLPAPGHAVKYTEQAAKMTQLTRTARVTLEQSSLPGTAPC